VKNEDILAAVDLALENPNANMATVVKTIREFEWIDIRLALSYATYGLSVKATPQALAILMAYRDK
jgi:EamA domain-containing membrane protein RarD